MPSDTDAAAVSFPICTDSSPGGRGAPATQAPGDAQRTLVRDALSKYRELTPQIDALWRDLEALEARLEAAGAPYTPNRRRGS